MKKYTISLFINLTFLSALVFPIVSLAQTGDVDPNLNSNECVNLTTNMRLGANDSTTNGQVSALQNFLIDKGYLNAEATGLFGRLTFAAVKKFQVDSGFVASGYVGPLTRAKINALYGCGNQTEPICTLTSNKATYTLGETILFSWTSQNATYAGWKPDLSGKDNLSVPGDKLPANGSQSIIANVLGNPSVTLSVGNGTSIGSCSKTVRVAVIASGPDAVSTSPAVVPAPTITMVSSKGNEDFKVNANGPAYISGVALMGDFKENIKVYVGGNKAKITQYGSNLLYVTIPNLSAGTYELYLINERGTSNKVRVRVLSPDPSVGIINPDVPTICATDAMQCSDGSYVSREAPSCQFRACLGGTVVNSSSTKPIITSISSTFGPVGTVIVLKGYNLLTNRGDQNIVIENENSKGEVASFGFGNPEHINLSEKYVSMRFTLNEKVCRQWATDVGSSCSKGWMTITPGEYKIYVASNGFADTNTISNKVVFTVTASLNTIPSTSSPVVCTADAIQCPDGSYVGRSGPSCQFRACSGAISTQPSITVLSPNGGEMLQTGQRYEIRWNSQNLQSSKVNVELWTLGSSVVTTMITTNAENTGSFSWFVPTNVATYSGYFVIIRVADSRLGTASEVYAKSGGLFTIAAPTQPQPSITVLSPNGGTYENGNSINIRWTSSNLDFSRISVSLVRIVNGVDSAVIGAFPATHNTNGSVPNTGSVTWTVPSNFVAGNYKVRLNPDSSLAGTVYNDSQIFSITAPVSVIQQSVTPNKSVVNSGESVALSYNVPTDTVAWKLYMSCPQGVAVLTSIGTDLCNTWHPFPMAPSGSTFVFKNMSSQRQNVVLNFYVYKNDRPDYALGVSTQITVSPNVDLSVPDKFSLSLTSTSEDYAGKFKGFGSGVGNNGLADDWGWTLQMSLGQAKTVKMMRMYHTDTGEYWSTNDESAYPLVVRENDSNLNSVYGATINLSAGSHTLKLYGQKEIQKFLGSKLTIAFTDGSSVVVDAPSGDMVLRNFGNSQMASPGVLFLNYKFSQ